MKKKQKRKLKNISIKKRRIIILSLLILLIIIITSICFLHKTQKIETIIREKSNIVATTNIQNIEIINISSQENKDKQHTNTLYILLKNSANTEQFLGDIQIELKDSTNTIKSIIDGYIPEIGANSNYEVKTVTNLDLTDITNINIIKKEK